MCTFLSLTLENIPGARTLPSLFGCSIGLDSYSWVFFLYIFFLFRANNVAIPSGALTLVSKPYKPSMRSFEVKATSVAIVLTEKCSPLPDANVLR